MRNLIGHCSKELQLQQHARPKRAPAVPGFCGTIAAPDGSTRFLSCARVFGCFDDCFDDCVVTALIPDSISSPFILTDG